jgi:hypothetical protein
LKELGEPEDGVEWRAELMAHRREELGLRGARRFCHGSCLAQLVLVDPLVGDVPESGDDPPVGGAALDDPQALPAPRLQVERAGWARVVRRPAADQVLGAELVDRERAGSHAGLDDVVKRAAHEVSFEVSPNQGSVGAVAHHEPIVSIEQGERTSYGLDRAEKLRLRAA